MPIEPLIDNPNVPVVYADGIEAIHIEGPNARIVFFEYRYIGEEKVRCPVAEIIRPLNTCDVPGFTAMLMESIASVARPRTGLAN